MQAEQSLNQLIDKTVQQTYLESTLNQPHLKPKSTPQTSPLCLQEAVEADRRRVHPVSARREHEEEELVSE